MLRSPPHTIAYCSHETAIHYPRFVALMLANVCGIKGTGFWPAAAGFAVLVVALWVLGKRGLAVIRGAAGAVDRVVVFLIGFALLFCVHAAIVESRWGFPALSQPVTSPWWFPHFSEFISTSRPRPLAPGVMVWRR